MRQTRHSNSGWGYCGRQFKDAHAYCASEFGNLAHCPSLRESGCFPAGLSQYVNRGPKAHAIRRPDGSAIFSRTSGTTTRLLTAETFKAEQKRTRPEQLKQLLLRDVHREQNVLPLYIVDIRLPLDPDARHELQAHAIVLDLTPGHAGIFDPNFGWIPTMRGWSNILSPMLHTLTDDYQALGMIAYQVVDTQRRCLCTGSMRQYYRK